MKKLHLLCNAHIDPVWQWEWEEGASAALSTFQSAANLAEEYDYIFCHNEVTLYKYIEKYAPALFEKIQQLVKAGKWHIMGGWYLQPDCVMPCGEGMVRQIREGELYFEEKFGVKPTTAVNFDPFGHSQGLVQIIKKCGQDSYIFMRPYSKYMPYPQMELPSECFIWEGYDGSQIKAYHITEYNSPLGGSRAKIETDIERMKDEQEVVLSPWGVGNHGGGPSRKDLVDIEQLIKESKDIEIVHSTPERFFAEVNPTDVVAKSLIPTMVGGYTAMVGMKQKYKTLERQLMFVEKMASIASLKGCMTYPTKQLREVTEDMLNVQFHDILPGTVIREGENNGFTYANHGLHILNQIRADAFFGLCKGQKTAEENTYPIMVFNPKAYAEKQLVECELSIIPTDYFEEEFSQLEIYDENGKKLPAQTIKEGSNLSIDWRKKVIFEAELAPLAITRLTAKTVVKPKAEYPTNQDVEFDNGEMQVRISAKTGLIESYVVSGKEYAQGNLFMPMMYEDYEDPWGMNQTYVGWNPQPFTLLEKPDGVFEGMQSIQVIEDGEIYTAVEAFFGNGHTRLRIGYKLYKKGTKVDIDVNVFPMEINRAIKLHLTVGGGEYIGEEIFGAETLYNDGTECIAHDYVAIKQDDGKYLEIVTPDNYASSYKDGTVALTLVRTATYCAHPVPKRPLVRKNIFLPRMDQGQRDFSFRMDVKGEKELKKTAELFVEKPYALNIFPTVDEKADNGLQVEIDNSQISFVTLKEGVQTDGYVFRLFNPSAEESKATLTCDNASISLHFGKYEVKTIIYQRNEFVEVADMLI